MQQAGTAGPMAKGQQQGQRGDPQQGRQGGPSAGGQGRAQSASPSGMMQPQGPVSSYLSSIGPNTPTTPQEMLQTANSMADELLGLPNSLKRSAQDLDRPQIILRALRLRLGTVNPYHAFFDIIERRTESSSPAIGKVKVALHTLSSAQH
jgi:hypothetical protein